MKNFKYILILLITMFLLSCQDDFLDREPSAAVPTTAFFTQEKDLEFALNAAYDLLGSNSDGTNYGSGTDMLRLGIMTDDAFDSHSWDLGFALGQGTADANDGYSNWRWKSRYQAIQRVNRIIEGADGIEKIDAGYKNQLVSEAKVIRAYCYLDLVYLFGDVPFLTSSITPEELEPSINEDGGLTPAAGAVRTDKTVILDALVSELSEITQYLPSPANTDKGRITRGAALFIKAKILLMQEKWTESAKASDDLMKLGDYMLYPSYKELFTYQGIGNSEVILDIQVIEGIGEGEYFAQNFGSKSAGGWSVATPLQSLIDTYEMTDGMTIEDSPLFDPESPYENRDPRLSYSILYPGAEWQGGIYNTIPGATYSGGTIVPGDDLTDGTGGTWNKTFSGYNFRKYITTEDIDNSTWAGSSMHFILMRYAEVLLMYAEAKIEAGSIDQSVLNAINEVRQRPDVMMPAVTTTSQSELRTIVRRERRVELVFEANRLFDIRRWGIAKDVMPGPIDILYYKDSNGNSVPIQTGLGERTFEAGKHELWPIPQIEINVSGMEQNPGW